MRIAAYLTNITYLQVAGRPSCRDRLRPRAYSYGSSLADDAIDVNIGFKQFVIAVDSYSATKRNFYDRQ